MTDCFVPRYFSELREIPTTYPYLVDDLRVEVAVIGGGLAGAAAAHALAKAGIQTALLEQASLGFGASASQPPVLLHDLGLSLSALAPRMGLRNAAEALRVLEAAPATLQEGLGSGLEDLGFAPRRSLCYTADPDQAPRLRAEYELRSRAGFQLRFLDKAAAAQLFPFPVEAGLLSETGCAQADPYLLVHRLAREAQALGARLFENTRIVRMQPLPGAVLLFSSLGKRIQARRVVLCTGPLAVPAELSLWPPRRVYGLASQALPPSEGWLDGYVCRRLDEELLLCRYGGKALLFGESLPVFQRKRPFGPRKAGSLDALRFLRLEQSLRALLPLCQELGVGARFLGVAQGRGLPRFRALPGAERVFAAANLGQNAIAASLVFGRLACAWALDEEPSYAPLFR